MNLTCEHVRDKLVDCISEHIDIKEDSTLVEHLRQCSECSKYYEGLRADDQALSDFANSMQPILARIEANVGKELEKGKIRSILSPHNKILKLAVAAVILIALTLSLNKFLQLYDQADPDSDKNINIIVNKEKDVIKSVNFDLTNYFYYQNNKEKSYNLLIEYSNINKVNELTIPYEINNTQ
jgi:hypothetical protein